MSRCAGLAALSALLATASAAQPLRLSDVAFGPPLLWVPGYSAPRIPMAGDADADGLTDFIGLYPPDGGILDYVRSSPLGKPIRMVQARRPFAEGAVAATCGEFAGGPGVEVVAILPDGTVRVAATLDRESWRYTEDVVAATLPADLLPQGSVSALAGDFDGDARQDVLIVSFDSGLLLLRNASPSEGPVAFEPAPVSGVAPRPRRLAAGRLPTVLPQSSDSDAVVWLDTAGTVWAATIETEQGGLAVARRARLAEASPDDGLAVGRFLGRESDDVLVGQRLLPGGSVAAAIFVPGLPCAAEAQGDLTWMAADVNGDGRDDLLRARRAADRFTGDDVVVHVVYRRDGTPPIADTDRDGLLDSWEYGLVKPGGLDLPALGCAPDHADVIVEFQPIEGVEPDRLRSEIQRAAEFYAALKVPNPDGRPGIGLRAIVREELPKDKEGTHWGQLAAEYHPKEHKGVTHWMLVGPGGGGQSSQMGDAGSCGIGAFYAVFLHEFGHQLGLDHTGYWSAAWCPTYPSMMNYAYSYQLGGDGSRICYSDGRLAGLILDERNLSERIQFAAEDLYFVAGPPYRFTVQPAPDRRGSLIDWNWNGVLGEEGVSADINYGYSTYAGPRHMIGKSRTAPALVAYREADSERLLLFAGDAARGERPEGVEPEHRLYVRVWEGIDPDSEGTRWSDEVDLEPAGLVGDPSAAFADGAAWVAYQMAEGVRIRRIVLGPGGLPEAGDASSVPDSTGAEPTLAAYGNGLALLLWRGPDAPVGLRLATPTEDGLSLGPETELPVVSLAPVGAAEVAGDAGPAGLWVGLTEDQDESRPRRWQVRRLEPTAEGGFVEAERHWVSGERGSARGKQRIALLCEPSADYPGGQLFFFQTGDWADERPWACHYVATRVRNEDIHGGWLVRRYYDEWSESRSGPGVCFFRGDIAYAMRWNAPPESEADNNLHVTFRARGIDQVPMGDFDDIGFIRDVGLRHSIPYLAE